MTYTVEELVINDSFIAYCNRDNANDMATWDDYLYHHPWELATVEEARQLVLGLQYMLQQKQNELSADDMVHPLSVVPDKESRERYRHLKPSKNFIRRIRYRVAIAAAVLLVAAGIFFFSRQVPRQATPATAAKDWLQPAGSAVQSQPGEYRTLILDDGTKVTLNAGSQLVVSENFGTKDRNVRLTGEAFFEVAHNRALPFIVQVARYKVKAVGTKFNVKAYANDRYSETSLLEGKVQILMNSGAQEVVYKTLDINQKFVLGNIDIPEKQTVLKPVVEPLTFDNTNQNIETAWVDHELLFEDQPLDEIKNTLERKFNVAITIRDGEVAKYRYTGSFIKENIDDVLKALQFSYSFSYKKDGNQITIYK